MSIEPASPTGAVRDRLHRPLHNLRVSVTDRCNMRCSYCMPEPVYTWLPKAEILSFEEIGALVGVFARLGVRKLRLTGGEPLLRNELETLISILVAVPGIEELAMTTNGVLLEERAASLRAAGLSRLTVSIDTLRPERHELLTQQDSHAAVLRGIAAASAAGFDPIKLNTVVLRGFNDDELAELLEFARDSGHLLRFIEYMDVGGATGWTSEQVVSRAEILERLAALTGSVVPMPGSESAPADLYSTAAGQVFGVVASTTAPFCRACDRGRITADGKFFSCLYGVHGLELGQALRAGDSARELEERIREGWMRRSDRAAEERLALQGRGPLASSEQLLEEPHLSMHTKGG